MYASIKIKIHTILGNKIKENRDWRTAKPLHDYEQWKHWIELIEDCHVNGYLIDDDIAILIDDNDDFVDDNREFISVGKLSNDEIITIAMSQLVEYIFNNADSELSNFTIDDIDKIKDAVSYVTNTDWYGFICRTDNGVNMVVLPESYYLEELPF